ncbi:DUF3055 domain-containing protein [Bacillus sp. 165]|uniref:DUF3055 domain-containing protein n=1 Tax=Bacillus sp. 165 TaxID=1529117 RepID=UPI001ADB1B44|nr:DUF3055 domain-containing protein [Bacillus sp. 165]
MFEKLYDEYENVKVRFIGFTTNDIRYDFGIVYTSMFFGKSLVVCMQTSRSALLGHDDIGNIAHLQQIFHIQTYEEAAELAEFLRFYIPDVLVGEQYDG